MKTQNDLDTKNANRIYPFKTIIYTEMAIEYGLNEAILIQYIAYWINENKNNNKNYFENRYWTYSTVSYIHEHIPYLSEKTIYRVLKKLENDGIIITGCYNKLRADRTKWYTLSDEVIKKLNNLELRYNKYIKPF